MHLLSLPAFILMALLEGKEAFALLVCSALFHELGHLTAIKLCNVSVRRVDITPMGAVICYPREQTDHKNDMTISLFGPLFSLMLCLAFCIAFFAFGDALSLFGVVSNLFLGITNLMPHRTLDGGRALFAFLCQRMANEKAEQICSALSQISKMLLILSAVGAFAVSGGNLGVLLLSAALVCQL